MSEDDKEYEETLYSTATKRMMELVLVVLNP